MPLKGLRARGYGRARLLVLGLAAVVVLDWCDRLVQGDVEIVVEIAPVRRDPRQAPAAARLIRRDLGQGRARDQHERRVPLMQQRQVAEGIYVTGAARAAILPRRVEHEVVHDELATAVE